MKFIVSRPFLKHDGDVTIESQNKNFFANQFCWGMLPRARHGAGQAR